MADPLSFHIESPDLSRAIALYGAAPQVVGAELSTAMTAAVADTEREVVERTPVNEGTLRNSIHGVPRGEGAQIYGVVATQQVLYAQAVETGAIAHWPPRAPLLAWVKKVWQLSGKRAEQAAYLVCRKISKKGTPGHHMFEQGAQAARPGVERLFARAAQRITERLGR